MAGSHDGPGPSVLEVRYGTARPRRTSLWIIALGALLGAGSSVLLELGLGAMCGVLVWAGALMLADRRLARARFFLPAAAVAYAAALMWPLLPAIVSSPESVLSVFTWVYALAYSWVNGLLLGAATLVVILLWFVRHGRLR
ncbi:hypothetical protein ACFQS2_02040 [Brachybacterium sp. GCM10030267]|uniref:hypothetical protein n=1 Tax=Brachybacterium sp. GCM10030267 TaxID=3273381 RepID=UPI003605F05F